MQYLGSFAEGDPMDATEVKICTPSASEKNSQEAQIASEGLRYEPLEILGKGAMGEVWLMRDIYLGRKVASKHLLPALNTPEIQQQFLNEAQITARLEHPGVVPVYTLEVDKENRLSYAMKVVQGKTLKQEIADLKKSLQVQPDRHHWQQALFRLLEVFLKVCDALAYVHSKGIIHRDLKPANIMIGPFREVYIVDWGLAQIWNDSETDCQETPRVIAGTPRYLSPEQARCLPLDPASDQFTMGLILQEILTLAPAFQANSMPEMLKKILKGQRAPCEYALRRYPIPKDLQAIVLRATALKPSARYPSMEELGADIRRFLQDKETTVWPDNAWRKAMRWIRHHPQQALLGCLMVLLVCSLAVAGSLWIWQQTLVQTQRRRVVLDALQRKMILIGQKLDSYLNRFEAQLEFLIGASAESWQRGRALPEHILRVEQLTTTGAHKPNWEHPLWLGNTTHASRLQSLDFIFQRIFAVSADPQGGIQAWLRSGKQEQAPLAWARVSFNRGPELIYPASLQALELSKHLKHWNSRLPPSSHHPTRPVWLGMLTLNAQNYFILQGPVLNDAQQHLGYANLLLRKEALEDTLKENPLLPGILSLEVTDAQGKILWSHYTHAIQAEQWPPPLIKALGTGKSGLYETPQILYAYQALATSDWRLVTRVNLKQLLKAHTDLHE